MFAYSRMTNNFIEIIIALNWKHRTRNIVKTCVLFSRCASNCTTYSMCSPTILNFFQWLQIRAGEDYIDITCNKSLSFRHSKSKENLAKRLSVALVVVHCLCTWKRDCLLVCNLYLFTLLLNFQLLYTRNGTFLRFLSTHNSCSLIVTVF